MNVARRFTQKSKWLKKKLQLVVNCKTASSCFFSQLESVALLVDIVVLYSSDL